MSALATRAGLHSVLAPASPLEALLARPAAKAPTAPQATGNGLVLSASPCVDPLHALRHAAAANTTAEPGALPCAAFV